MGKPRAAQSSLVLQAPWIERSPSLHLGGSLFVWRGQWGLALHLILTAPGSPQAVSQKFNLCYLPLIAFRKHGGHLPTLLNWEVLHKNPLGPTQ